MAALDLAIRFATPGISGAIGGIRGVSGAIGGLSAGLFAPVRAAQQLAHALGTIGLAADGLRAVAGAAVGIGDVLGLGLASEMENTRAALFSMTKDMGLTDSLLAAFQARADKTPFSLREISAAAVGLLPASKMAGVGLDNLLDTSQLLAALNPAEGLKGAAFAIREALSGDWVSLQERFNLSREALNRLRAQGLPAIQVITQALGEMGVDSSLVARMGETLTGRWSTFKDTIDGLRRTLATPLLEGLKEGLISLQGQLDANKPALTAFAAEAGRALGSLAGRAVASIPFAVDAIRTLVGALSGSWQPAPGIAAAHVTIGNIGLAVRSAWDGVATFIGALSGTWKPAPGITQFHTMVGNLGLGVAFARDALVTLISAISGDWAGSASSEINPIHQAIGNIGVFIRTTVLPALVDFGKWFATDGIRLLTAFGGFIGAVVLPALERFGEWFLKTGLPAIQDFASWFSTNILPTLTDFATLVAGEVLTKVTELGNWLAGDGKKAAQDFGAWFQADGIPLLESFRDVAAKVGGLIVDVVGPALVTFKDNAADIAKELKPLLDAVGDLTDLLKPFAQLVGLAFGAIAAAVPGLLRQLTGFITGITGVAEVVIAALTGISTAFAALNRGDVATALAALQKSWTDIGTAMTKVATGNQAIGEGQQMVTAGEAAFAGKVGLGPILPSAPGTATERPPALIGPPTPTQEQLDAQQRHLDQIDRHTKAMADQVGIMEKWNQAMQDAPYDLQIAFARALGT